MRLLRTGPGAVATTFVLLAGAACCLAQSPQVLSSDFLIHPHPTSGFWFENTLRVLPPSGKFPQGKVVMVLGQPRPLAKLLHRPLYTTGGKLATSKLLTKYKEFPTGPTKAVGTDNQLIRLKDGTLLAF